MNKKLNKIGKNSKIAQQNELSSIIKNKVLKIVTKNLQNCNSSLMNFDIYYEYKLIFHF